MSTYIRPKTNRWQQARLSSFIVSLPLLLTACLGLPEKPSEPTPPTIPTGPTPHQIEIQSLQQQMQALNDENTALNAEVANLQLRNLEKSSKIKQLREQQVAQNKRLDDTIQEVVRTKAKLRSRNSKAESVTSLAELAIDLKTLIARHPSADDDPQIERAEQLLNHSNQEFKAGNHAGAFYLANKTRSLIQSMQARMGNQSNRGSTANLVNFASPLPMRAISRSNIRALPDIKGPVIRKIEQGETAMAIGYQNLWVKIELEDGRSGWIYYKLLAAQQ